MPRFALRSAPSGCQSLFYTKFRNFKIIKYVYCSPEGRAKLEVPIFNNNFVNLKIIKDVCRCPEGLYVVRSETYYLYITNITSTFLNLFSILKKIHTKLPIFISNKCISRSTYSA